MATAAPAPANLLVLPAPDRNRHARVTLHAASALFAFPERIMLPRDPYPNPAVIFLGPRICMFIVKSLLTSRTRASPD